MFWLGLFPQLGECTESRCAPRAIQRQPMYHRGKQRGQVSLRKDTVPGEWSGSVRPELSQGVVGEAGVEARPEVDGPGDIAVRREPVLGGGHRLAVHAPIRVDRRPRHRIVDWTLFEGRVLL